jgi:2-keto-4-pentenoate hydratase/2-oxohepta-3-ene-1,7-dioic acid hydratase in catechol pathway
LRLATLGPHDDPRVVLVEGDELVDVTVANPSLPRDLTSLLGGGRELEAEIVRAARRAPRLDLSDAPLLAPVPRPGKLLAIGLNYRAHVAETGRRQPYNQLWFNKQTTCVIGPGEAIEVPVASPMVDYEGELAFVIGRRCRHVSASRAPDVIGGYTILNDVSVRDWQARSPTMTLGKSFDTHGPMGPSVVTGDELGDPHSLHVRTRVNGDIRQDAGTDDMIFDCYEQVAHLSSAFTLEPGDVISTGTPAGVGMAMDPPSFLKAGDVVVVEIEGIGVLENPVKDEQAADADQLW